MADEITISVSMGCVNGNYDPGTVRLNNLTFDQAAAGAVGDIQNIGTSEESLATGDISTEGWIILRNLDATNYIEIGATTAGNRLIRLEAGEPACFRVKPGATIYCQADTAACDLFYRLLED